MGIVYVLINPAFEGYVKIGKTTDLVQRLKSLDNTSVQLAFRCVHAVEVDDMDNVERLCHAVFADHRTRKTREFFEVDPQRVIAALKLANGKDVTPKDDIAEDAESIKAMNSVSKAKRRAYSLMEANLKIGDILKYANNEAITATVISDRKVQFEHQDSSLSSSALTLLQRDGYNWQKVNGWLYWTFEGETVAERLNRILSEEENE